MLGLKFFKSLPTDYVFKYVNGRAAQEGVGLAFSYLQHNTQIVVVPISDRFGEASFSAATRDLKAVSVRMQFTFRIIDPHQAAAQFDFSLDTSRRHLGYATREADQLMPRVAEAVQRAATAQIRNFDVETLISSLESVAQSVRESANISSELQTVGAEIVTAFLVKVEPRNDIQIVGSASSNGLLVAAPLAQQNGTTENVSEDNDENGFVERRTATANSEAWRQYNRRATDVAPGVAGTSPEIIAHNNMARDENASQDIAHGDVTHGDVTHSDVAHSDVAHSDLNHDETRNDDAPSSTRSRRRARSVIAEAPQSGNYLFVSPEAAQAAKLQAAENRARAAERGLMMNTE